MPAEICLKLPLNFRHREEVVRFGMEMARRDATVRPEDSYLAFLICLDFAGQGKEWRALYSAPVDGVVDWSSEPLATIIANSCGLSNGAHLIEAGLDSKFLVLKMHADIAGLACPLFNEWNPHLLPGFISMQKKGQMAAMEKRRRQDDPVVARQQRKIFQRQELLNLGELGADVTPDEIEQAIALVMQIDRAGGMAVRKTSEYAIWLLAAAVRLIREKTPRQIEAFLAFLLEARADPTVQKGAELVLQHSATLLERSGY